MPDLHSLLTEAAPPVEPDFDLEDLRSGVRAVERRRRRLMSGISLMILLAVVLGVAGIVLTPAPSTTDLAGPAGLEEWPVSVDFVGVEIEVVVRDDANEPMQSRVTLGDGDAALNWEPSDAVELGNTSFQRVQNRIWFSCGATDAVIRMTEVGRVQGGPDSQFGGAGSGRLLSAAVLVEAARQTTVDMGCTPAAPAGTPEQTVTDLSWLGPLAAAMDDATMATCCSPPGDVDVANQWGVLLEGDDRLSLSVGSLATDLLLDQPVEAVPLGEGRGARQLMRDTPGEAVVFTCGPATILARPISGEIASVERFVEQIDCAPTVPDAIRPAAELTALLTGIGVDEVSATRTFPAIADVTVLLDGREFRVRAGDASQVVLYPQVPGVTFTCIISYSIEFGADATEQDAQALADRIVAETDCPLPGAFGSVPRDGTPSLPPTPSGALTKPPPQPRS